MLLDFDELRFEFSLLVSNTTRKQELEAEDIFVAVRVVTDDATPGALTWNKYILVEDGLNLAHSCFNLGTGLSAADFTLSPDLIIKAYAGIEQDVRSEWLVNEDF